MIEGRAGVGDLVYDYENSTGERIENWLNYKIKGWYKIFPRESLFFAVLIRF